MVWCGRDVVGVWYEGVTVWCGGVGFLNAFRDRGWALMYI